MDTTNSLHPFAVGPIRLTSIAHAFNYRVTVLRDGMKSAACMVCRLMLFWPANHGDICTMVVGVVSASLRTAREPMFMTCRLLPVGATPPL